ncbi:hypothetical protein [Adhaeribacter radiodurans]|uniref:Uncharacterized protein n=1 Tax=Adhaeribacter radiodurans TaxID=2745197 RepID=A0A7L7LBD5_9BACT|nr:hypothetical protein [Adhaeribacter radiodurans]QMU29865.1 hypothetical protein HUW48_18360 [Adhaeribacter radiodurans]
MRHFLANSLKGSLWMIRTTQNFIAVVRPGKTFATWFRFVPLNLDRGGVLSEKVNSEIFLTRKSRKTSFVKTKKEFA